MLEVVSVCTIIATPWFGPINAPPPIDAGFKIVRSWGVGGVPVGSGEGLPIK
jgi:hypothetical protein